MTFTSRSEGSESISEEWSAGPSRVSGISELMCITKACALTKIQGNLPCPFAFPHHLDSLSPSSFHLGSQSRAAGTNRTWPLGVVRREPAKLSAAGLRRGRLSGDDVCDCEVPWPCKRCSSFRTRSANAWSTTGESRLCAELSPRCDTEPEGDANRALCAHSVSNVKNAPHCHSRSHRPPGFELRTYRSLAKIMAFVLLAASCAVGAWRRTARTADLTNTARLAADRQSSSFCGMRRRHGGGGDGVRRVFRSISV